MSSHGPEAVLEYRRVRINDSIGRTQDAADNLFKICALTQAEA